MEIVNSDDSGGAGEGRGILGGAFGFIVAFNGRTLAIKITGNVAKINRFGASVK